MGTLIYGAESNAAGEKSISKMNKHENREGEGIT